MSQALLKELEKQLQVVPTCCTGQAPTPHFHVISRASVKALTFSCSSAINSETQEEVAIKKISNAFENRIDAKRTLREIKLLRHMDHENVSDFRTSSAGFNGCP